MAKGSFGTESSDPNFWPKMRRIRSLYRKRPKGGRRICIDECGPLNQRTMNLVGTRFWMPSISMHLCRSRTFSRWLLPLDRDRKGLGIGKVLCISKLRRSRKQRALMKRVGFGELFGQLLEPKQLRLTTRGCPFRLG